MDSIDRLLKWIIEQMGHTLGAENPLWKQLRVSSSRLMFMLAAHLNMNQRRVQHYGLTRPTLPSHQLHHTTVTT